MGKMPFNWFDVLLVLLLIVGIYRGRKRGMSQEIMPLFKWITIVLVCGFAYQPVADLVRSLFTCSPFSAVLSSYLGMAAIIAILFAAVNKSLGGKIIGSDAFGQGEYYLGIFSGLIRYSCVMVFSLALLNAPLYTQKEIADHNRFVQQNYDHDFFPTFFQVQDQVFKESLAGPTVVKGVDFLLIKRSSTQSGAYKRRELDLPM